MLKYRWLNISDLFPENGNSSYVAVTYVVNTVLAPAVGEPLKPQTAAEGEKVLLSSLSKLEEIWLNGDGDFLLGGFQPSIADISMVCELMQLEVTICGFVFYDIIEAGLPKKYILCMYMFCS